MAVEFIVNLILKAAIVISAIIYFNFDFIHQIPYNITARNPVSTHTIETVSTQSLIEKLSNPNPYIIEITFNSVKKDLVLSSLDNDYIKLRLNEFCVEHRKVYNVTYKTKDECVNFFYNSIISINKDTIKTYSSYEDQNPTLTSDYLVHQRSDNPNEYLILIRLSNDVNNYIYVFNSNDSSDKNIDNFCRSYGRERKNCHSELSSYFIQAFEISGVEYPWKQSVESNNTIESNLDAKKDSKPEIKEEVKPEIKEEVKPEIKEEVKPEIKEEAKPEIKEEVKPEIKEEPKPEIKEEIAPIVSDIKVPIEEKSELDIVGSIKIGEISLKFSYDTTKSAYDNSKLYCEKYWDSSIIKAINLSGLSQSVNKDNCPNFIEQEVFKSF